MRIKDIGVKSYKKKHSEVMHALEAWMVDRDINRSVNGWIVEGMDVGVGCWAQWSLSTGG